MQQRRMSAVRLFAMGFLLTLASANLSAQTYTYKDLHDFSCSTEGCSPQFAAILAQGRDGNLYGTMMNGGKYSFGTFFKATPEGTVTVPYTFAGNNGNGITPRSG